MAERKVLTYGISEIFFSLQGEGAFTGTPMIFVRFAGCDYSCSWCDTDFSLNRRLSLEDLKQAIVDVASLSPQPIGHICLTGGEPTLYRLDPLMDSFMDQLIENPPIRFHIETHGGGDHLRYMGRAFVTVSPKHKDGSPLESGSWICDQLKLVDQDQDLSRFEAFNSKGRAALKYLQPMDRGDKILNQIAIEGAVDRVKENPGWKLSLQTHKILDIR